MKKILFVLVATASFVACKTEDKKVKDSPVLSPEQKDKVIADSSNFTSIQWLDSTYLDLGKVKKGATVEVTFRFKNTGSKQLVITDVHPGCGCTVPDKPEKPFAPGEEGVIKAKFNSEGQSNGEHRKNITVTSNTNPTTALLEFRVDVTDK